MDQTIDDRIDDQFRTDSGLAAEFGPHDPLVSRCVVALVRTQLLLTDELNRRLRPYDVSLTGFLILGLLRVGGGVLRPGTIARWLRMTRGTVTGLLDSLEKRGFVRRLNHPDDRRMLRIELTEGARELQAVMVPAMFGAEREIVSSLSVAEREELVRLLGKVQSRLLTIGRADSSGNGSDCPPNST